MRPLQVSESTRQLLVELGKAKPGVWKLLTKSASGKSAEIFEQIASADELDAVPSLANYIAADAATASAAKAAIRKIMSGRAPDELVRLDEACRQISRYSCNYWPWAQIHAGQVSRIASRDDVLILGLLSFHPSGFVRSYVIRSLAKLKSGAELPYLIIRVNDWVDEVRELAWKAIRSRFVAGYSTHLARNMSLILALEAKTRTSMVPLLADFYGFLKEHPEGLQRAVGSTNFRIRRAAFQAAYKLDEIERVPFVSMALQDSDSLTRLNAARQAAALSDKSLRDSFLKSMLDDRWHAVRAQALRMAVADSSESTKEILIQMLLDRSRSVRASARFYLGRMGVGDFRRTYLSELNGNQQVTAIAGLGECGVPEDAEVIAPFLKSTTPKILAAALMATSRLLPEECDDLLTECLAHPNRSVSNAAARQLKGRVSDQTRPAINQIYEDQDQSPHARFNALKLLGSANKWDRVIYWLRGVSDSSPRISGHCERGLRRWQYQFNRTFTEPTDEQLESIRELMSKRSFRHQPIAKFLTSVMRSF